MSGFGNLQPGYVEPIGSEPVSRRVDYLQNRSRHGQALDDAFEVEPCSECCATGKQLDGSPCKSCWGHKDVPLTEEQWRAAVCDQFAADVQTAIDDLTKSLASHDQNLFPDEAMVQLAQRAQQAAVVAAKAWRSSPDRRAVMQVLGERKGQ